MKSIRLLGLAFTLASLFIVLAAQTSVYSQGKGNAKGAKSAKTGNKPDKANQGNHSDSGARGAKKNRTDPASTSDNNGGLWSGNPNDIDRKKKTTKAHQNNGVRDGGQGVGRGKGQGKGQGAQRRELKGQNSQVRSGDLNTTSKPKGNKPKKKPGR